MRKGLAVIALALVGAVGFVVAFALAFAGWRWGLGDTNWFEGAIIATIVGGVVAAVVVAAVDVRQKYVARHRGDVSTTGEAR